MKIQRYGWIRQHPDIRDRKMLLRAPVTLPLVVDLRDRMPPVWDQGDLGSCTAHGILAAAMVAGSAGDPDAPPSPMLSRLFLYYCERDIEGSVDQDSGAQIRDGFKALNRWGVPLEETWPYDVKRYAVKPDAVAYDEALSDVAVVYSAVPQDAVAMKTALAQGHPVVVGFTVYESFESDEVAKIGLVPMPLDSEQVVGGHCVCVTGYDDSKGVWIVRNSWGDGWGIAGYFLMPYDYLLNPDLSDDFWIVEKMV